MSTFFRAALEQNITPKRCGAMDLSFGKSMPQGLEKTFGGDILPSSHNIKVLKAKEFCILEKSSQGYIKKLNKQVNVEDIGKVGTLGQGAIKMAAVMFQMVLEKGINMGWDEFLLQSNLLVG